MHASSSEYSWRWHGNCAYHERCICLQVQDCSLQVQPQNICSHCSPIFLQELQVLCSFWAQLPCSCSASCRHGRS